jgi:hypothetical protein
VDPFRGMGMPRIPGLSELLSLLQTQTEALAQLPTTLRDGAVQVAVEVLVEELEEPVRALKPGLERVGRVLDDPAIDTVPDTLRRIHDDLMPLISGLRQAQARVGSVTGLLRRRPREDEDDDDWGAATRAGT